MGTSHPQGPVCALTALGGQPDAQSTMLLDGREALKLGEKNQNPPQSRRVRGCPCEQRGAACLGKEGCQGETPPKTTCQTEGQQEAVEAAEGSEGVRGQGT